MLFPYLLTHSSLIIHVGTSYVLEFLGQYYSEKKIFQMQNAYFSREIAKGVGIQKTVISSLIAQKGIVNKIKNLGFSMMESSVQAHLNARLHSSVLTHNAAALFNR